MNTPKPQPDSAELTRVQQWFQAVITHGEGIEAGVGSAEAQRLLRLTPSELERVVTRSRALTAAERLAIYANAYHSRLLECLGEVFPMLKRALGEEAFDGLAFGYLQEYPSRTYTLNELGRHFPHYLEQTRPAPDSEGDVRPDLAAPDATTKPGKDELRESLIFGPRGTRPSENSQSVLPADWPDFLIDLARLEWAIYDVFDGPGVEGATLLGADHLLGVSAERWPQAKLLPVVCLRLLATRFPVNDYFTAMRKVEMDQVVPMPAAADSFVALTRRKFIVRRYNLSRPEFELLERLKEGRTVGEAVESIASWADPDLDRLAENLRTWFRNWTAEGFFESVSFDPGSC